MITAKHSLYRILVVDDEPIICELLAEALSGPNRSIETRNDGQSALELMERNPVDLAFLDVNMPGMSGLELAQQIKKKSPNTHIIFCTGYYGQDICEKAEQLSVERVFEKPLNFGELLHLADTYTVSST